MAQPLKCNESMVAAMTAHQYLPARHDKLKG
jgi:hypothetical protein